MRIIKITIAFLILSVSVYAQTENVVTFNDAKMNVAWQHYSKMKNALIESKQSETHTAALSFEKSLKDVKDATEVMTLAGKMGAASTLQEQRKLFAELNNALSKLISKGNLSSGTIYKDYCPMANDNEGAFWYSADKPISNPYFGDMMLRCGAVKETIQ